MEKDALSEWVQRKDENELGKVSDAQTWHASNKRQRIYVNTHAITTANIILDETPRTILLIGPSSVIAWD